MSKLYTKTGDKGLTNLYDMSKLGKDDLVFEVLGDLDELSCCIGICTSLIINEKTIFFLRWIQGKLLDIGSDIATRKNRDKIIPITFQDVEQVEKNIDFYDSKCEKLKEFILPGNKTVDANLHFCRAVCRRTERHFWKCKKEFETQTQTTFLTSEETPIFLNRLSDLLFALARFYSQGEEIKRSETEKYNFLK